MDIPRKIPIWAKARNELYGLAESSFSGTVNVL